MGYTEVPIDDTGNAQYLAYVILPNVHRQPGAGASSKC
jgi:hypothetical protein